MLEKLKDNETPRTVLTTNWYKHPQLRENVEEFIGKILDEKLPDAYDGNIFKQKWKSVSTHVYNTASRGKTYWR